MTTALIPSSSTFDSRKYTSSPLRFEGIARYDVPPGQLFAAVSEPEGLHGWLPMLKSLKMDHSASRAGREACGVGSVRSCSFRMMGDVAERIVWWDPPYGYAFDFAPARTAMMPTRNHLVAFLVKTDGQGGSEFTFRTYFEWRDTLMRHVSVRMMPMMLNQSLINLRKKFGGPGGKMRRVS